MSRCILKVAIDEDLVFLFLPPSGEQPLSLIDSVIDSIESLSENTPEFVKRSVVEN